MASVGLSSISCYVPSKRKNIIAVADRVSVCSLIFSHGSCFTRDSRFLSGKTRRRFLVSSAFGRKINKTQPVIIPDPDYRIPIVLLGLAGGLAYTDNTIPAIPVGLLGLLLLFQTTRVRFVFDDDSLEVKVGDELQDSGENAFVGGKNRWKYSSFVNWELWWPSFPILVYFKETQTKPEGQIHFFPVIFTKIILPYIPVHPIICIITFLVLEPSLRKWVPQADLVNVHFVLSLFRSSRFLAFIALLHILGTAVAFLADNAGFKSARVE